MTEQTHTIKKYYEIPNTSEKYKEWTPAYVIETYKKIK